MFCSNAMLLLHHAPYLRVKNSLMNRLQGWCHSRTWVEVVSLWELARCKCANCMSASQSWLVASLRVRNSWESLAGVLTSTSSCFIHDMTSWYFMMWSPKVLESWDFFNLRNFSFKDGWLIFNIRWWSIMIQNTKVLTNQPHITFCKKCYAMLYNKVFF